MGGSITKGSSARQAVRRCVVVMVRVRVDRLAKMVVSERFKGR